MTQILADVFPDSVPDALTIPVPSGVLEGAVTIAGLPLGRLTTMQFAWLVDGLVEDCARISSSVTASEFGPERSIGGAS